MKKKFLALILCAVCISGCGTSYDPYREHYKPYGGGYFTEINSWVDETDVRITYRIVFANDTHVMYLLTQGQGSSGITPLYNEDGTLQKFEEN